MGGDSGSPQCKTYGDTAMTTATQQRPLSQAERYQDWGVDHPIPELEAVLAELNRHRPKRFGKGSPAWPELQKQAYRKAARLLGIVCDAQNRRNATIYELTRYRADWRGYTVTSASGVLR
jgi:hypothetical protein